MTVLVLVCAGGFTWDLVSNRPGCLTALAARQVSRLALFESWLQHNHAKGYVGEVGWPGAADATEWNSVAQAWLAEADRGHLWVTAWAAGRWWPRDYPMAVYRFADTPSGTPVAGNQAAVLEMHAKPKGALRGIDVPSGAFATADEGTSSYNNAHPGVYDVDYRYDEYADYHYLYLHGYQMVRLSFTWERLQPRLGGPLDQAAVQRLIGTLRAAARAGMGVLLDLHNFGGYWVAAPDGTSRRLTLGSAELPASAFAGFWGRLVSELHDVPGILGYGLMNEPRHLAESAEAGARLWQDASQAAVTAIRDTGDQRLLLVSGYADAAPEQFAALHHTAWISDPADAVRYEAHQYFDADGAGHYRSTYAVEERSAAARQASTAPSARPLAVCI